MGRRGPRAKPPDRQQGHRDAPLTPVLGERREIVPPRQPSKLLQTTLDAWDDFWASDLAQLTKPGDYPAIKRYFRYLDEWSRCIGEALKTGRLVLGSKDQQRISRYLNMPTNWKSISPASKVSSD